MPHVIVYITYILVIFTFVNVFININAIKFEKSRNCNKKVFTLKYKIKGIRNENRGKESDKNIW